MPQKPTCSVLVARKQEWPVLADQIQKLVALAARMRRWFARAARMPTEPALQIRKPKVGQRQACQRRRHPSQ